MDKDLSPISCISPPVLANQERLDAVFSDASVVEHGNCVAAAAGATAAGILALGPIQWTTPSSHPSYYAFATSDDRKTCDLCGEELEDVENACMYIAKYAAKPLVKKKRERSLYTYNFSPPSTPRGNHTITIESIDADTVTTRCSMKRLMSIQQEDRPGCIVCGAWMQSMACNRMCVECNKIFID